MDAPVLLAIAKEALLLVVLMSAPPVGASLLVGVLVSLVQAVTQVQEATLTVVPKLCAAGLALVLAGPWISDQLSRFALQVLVVLPQVGS